MSDTSEPDSGTSDTPSVGEPDGLNMPSYDPDKIGQFTVAPIEIAPIEIEPLFPSPALDLENTQEGTPGPEITELADVTENGPTPTVWDDVQVTVDEVTDPNTGPADVSEYLPIEEATDADLDGLAPPNPEDISQEEPNGFVPPLVYPPGTLTKEQQGLPPAAKIILWIVLLPAAVIVFITVFLIGITFIVGADPISEPTPESTVTDNPFQFPSGEPAPEQFFGDGTDPYTEIEPIEDIPANTVFPPGSPEEAIQTTLYNVGRELSNTAQAGEWPTPTSLKTILNNSPIPAGMEMTVVYLTEEGEVTTDSEVTAGYLICAYSDEAEQSQFFGEMPGFFSGTLAPVEGATRCNGVMLPAIPFYWDPMNAVWSTNMPDNLSISALGNQTSRVGESVTAFYVENKRWPTPAEVSTIMRSVTKKNFPLQVSYAQYFESERVLAQITIPEESMDVALSGEGYVTNVILCSYTPDGSVFYIAGTESLSSSGSMVSTPDAGCASQEFNTGGPAGPVFWDTWFAFDVPR